MRISLLSGLLLATTVAMGQDAGQTPPANHHTFTDPNKAGRDFAIQGEYRGESRRGGQLKADVIADGDGKFTVKLTRGGLPNEKRGSDQPVVFTAETKDGHTLFDGEFGRGEIDGGKLPIAIGGATTILRRIVRQSDTLNKKPPPGAVVLFNGTSADQWENGQLVEKDLLRWGATSKAKFNDCSIHLEFRLPFMPRARGQDRANSGVYVQGRYEVQILDSFGLPTKDNECGGIYQVSAPKTNMCFPPLSWQTYDIDFTAAKFDRNGTKLQDAEITVRHNGTVIQDKVRIPAPTGGSLSKESPEPGPIHLQDHGNPVVFRNIWVVETK